VTPDERQRLLLGLLLAAHDTDERAFQTLLRGVPRPELLILVRNLAEGVINWQSVTEEWPGAARAHIAEAALDLAGRGG
jgi:hypothetical protein